jgi:Holliday junction resolvase
MNAKRKGTRNEHKSRRLLKTAGYAVTRAAGSLGAWDLVGIGPTEVVLLQVKSNRSPTPAEREALALAGPVAKLLGQFSDNFDLDGYPSSQLCEKKSGADRDRTDDL